jgi:hypothetical protein
MFCNRSADFCRRFAYWKTSDWGQVELLRRSLTLRQKSLRSSDTSGCRWAAFGTPERKVVAPHQRFSINVTHANAFMDRRAKLTQPRAILTVGSFLPQDP